MIVTFFFLLIFPFRYIVLTIGKQSITSFLLRSYLIIYIVVKKFVKGYFYYKWKYINNRRVATILLQDFHKKHGYKNVDFDDPWVFLNTKNWIKDLILNIRQRTGAYIEKKDIQSMKTPGDMVH